MVTATRSFAEWDAHPQGRAVAGLPLFTIERIGDAPPQPLPAGERPLAGVKVLDLTRVIAGPVCGRTLAAHGADVLNITAAHLPAMEALVIDTGRGKLSAQIDLREAARARDARRRCCARRTFSSRAIGRAPSRNTASAPRKPRGCGPASSASRSAPMATKARGPTGAASTRWCRTPTASTSPRPKPPAPATEPKPLPAQALDHATGYLMAFGAMTALKRRATEGGSWHVRCSLAQTGHWFRNLGRIEGGLACPDPSFDDVRDLHGGQRVRLRPADRRAPFRRHVGDAGALGAAVGAARHPRGRNGRAEIPLNALSAARPGYFACGPSSCSIRSSWLYLAVRSERASEPVLICPQLVATARSAMVESSVSPERCDITAV